jgi:hypothetical protein
MYNKIHHPDMRFSGGKIILAISIMLLLSAIITILHP